MGGFVKKFAPMMGALILGHPSTYYGYFFWNFTFTWGTKWPFPYKMTQFLPIRGGFSINFALVMGVFFSLFATEGIFIMGYTFIAISWVSNLPGQQYDIEDVSEIWCNSEQPETDF